MNRQGYFVGRWVKAPSFLTASGVLLGFTLLLLMTIRLGLPLWSLFIPVAGLTYAALVVHRPVVGLFVVLFIFFLPLQIGGFTLLQVLGASTVGLVGIWFIKEQRPIRLGNVFLPLAIFAALIVASFFFTISADRTLFYVRRWIFNVVFYVLLVNVVTTAAALKRVTWAIVAAASINACFGVVEYLGSTEFYYRAEGLVGNQNGLGNLSVLAFPLAFYYYLYSRGVVRWISLVLCGLLTAGVVVSVSRGAFIAFSIVFAWTVMRERARRGMMLVAVVVALLAAPLVPQYFKERMSQLSSDVRSTIPVGTEQLSTRGQYNVAALKIWKAFPVLGVGVGNFGHYFVREEFNPGKSGTTKVAVHNMYLQTLAECGTVGAALMLWIILITAHNLKVARRIGRESGERWSHLGAVEMMALAVFIYNFSSGNLVSQGTWAVVGLVAATYQVALNQQASRAAATA